MAGAQRDCTRATAGLDIPRQRPVRSCTRPLTAEIEDSFTGGYVVVITFDGRKKFRGIVFETEVQVGSPVAYFSLLTYSDFETLV